nr:TetR-like C-terminal domain-containing protein [Kineosporia mesophila]
MAYLDFARDCPGRYRTMSGDARTTSVPGVPNTVLRDCVVSGRSSCSGSSEDAMSLWPGLHGLAHQRDLMHTFPWPDRLDRLMISTLAHLVRS